MEPDIPPIESGAAIRERLLAQQSPDATSLERYRKEIAMTLAQNERGLRRERRYSAILWIFLVTMCTAFLIVGGMHVTTSLGVWFGVMACFWLLFGAVELLKHFINRARVDLLMEVKGLELRVLELQEQVRGGSKGGAA